jgi:hypothetical protein
MSLVYVAEKVETVELSYRIREKQRSMAETYDHLKTVRYRLASLKSPSRLQNQMLDSKLELVPVREVRILRFAKKNAPVPLPSLVKTELPQHNRFLSVREAQAKTDDPS